MMSSRRVIRLCFVHALLAGMPGLFFQAAKAAESPSARPALTITAEAPRQEVWPDTLSAYGEIAARREIVISAENDGMRLLALPVDVGGTVRRGDVLARFDSEQVDLALRQAAATLNEAQAAAREAGGLAARARQLRGTGALSQQQIDSHLAAAETAAARVEAAKAAVALQELRARKLEIKAPEDGVVSLRQAVEGQVVAAGSPLFHLIAQGRLEWRAEVSAQFLHRLTPGMAVQVQGPDGRMQAGQVARLGPALDVRTRRGLVYVHLMNDPGALRAGMLAQGRFVLGTLPVQTVPLQALVFRDGRHYVFQVQEDGRVKAQQVQAGARQGDRIAVQGAGLSAASSVAVAGAGFLNDGDRVRVAVQGSGS